MADEKTAKQIFFLKIYQFTTMLLSRPKSDGKLVSLDDYFDHIVKL